MDLSALSSSLPPGLADAEREMGDKFKAAAMSITHLYKSSLGYTKQAYQAGYAAALADVLSTVQSSIGEGQDAEGSLSRLMDWAEARQAAMVAFAAEEEDDSAPRPPSKRPGPAQAASAGPAGPHRPHLSSTHIRPASAPPDSSPILSHVTAHVSASAANARSRAQLQPPPQPHHISSAPNVLASTSSLSAYPAAVSASPMGKSSSSAPLQRHRDALATPHASAGSSEDPDRTFVQFSPPSPSRASAGSGHVGAALANRQCVGAEAGPSRHLSPDTPGTAASSPTISRAGHQQGFGAGSGLGARQKSPLRYRHSLGAPSGLNHDAALHTGEASVRATGAGLGGVTMGNSAFNPSLPGLAHTVAYPSHSHGSTGNADEEGAIGIGMKRPAASARLDSDVSMEDDMCGMGMGVGMGAGLAGAPGVGVGVRLHGHGAGHAHAPVTPTARGRVKRRNVLRDRERDKDEEGKGEREREREREDKEGRRKGKKGLGGGPGMGV